jgi:glycosyltransferase involved in cell wall biosynthesis
MMKILFINSGDTSGGAAIAAARMARGLHANYGTLNYFLVGKKNSFDQHTFQTTASEYQACIEQLIDMTTNRLGLQYPFFPFSSRNILKTARDLKPDIISLHNTHGGYFRTTLIKELSSIAPVVWTLHDMWSFTGNAAHAFGDEAWMKMENPQQYTSVYPAIGINTGRYLLRQKMKTYSRSDLTIVTPSQWLYRLASRSPVFRGKKLECISHGVDNQIFRPKDKRACRLALSLPEHGKILMFCAEFTHENLWKGGSELLGILKAIDSRSSSEVNILVLGKGNLKTIEGLNRLRIYNMGYAQGEEFVSQCFSAADLVMYPTRADNMPLVLLEAISCGTPCIATDIGGCPEIIRDGTNGVLVAPLDIEGYAEHATALLSDDERLMRLSKSARDLAVRNFSMEQMASRYFGLFKSILEGRGRPDNA